MVYQKELLWQIHDAGILPVEGVVGMDLIDKHNTIDAVNDAIAEYIPLLEGKCIEIPLAIARAIMNMPSAKSSIIRCKDCKHRDSNNCPMYYEEWIEIDEGDGYFDTDTIIHDPTTDEGFCHCAELRGKEK